MRAPRPLPLVVAATVALSAGAAGCAPDPVFDDDIGVTAEPAPVGSLAGTFGIKTVNSTLVHAGPLGEQQGGGANFRLVTRTYDDLADVYLQESRLCGGFNFPVLDAVLAVPESIYRKVAPSTEERLVVSADGTYTATKHIQLWALKDLEDPFNDELPATREEALDSPLVFDMDEDDKPGITSFVTGPIVGEIYVYQRKTVSLKGVTLGADHAVGLAQNKNEALTLGTDNDLLDRQGEGSAEPFPDPKESWFEEIRLADDADCDDVMQASEDDKLHRLRPF